MLEVINAADREVADAVHAELDRIAQAVDGIAERMEKGGRLFYTGAGTSGRLGVLDASECPPTFNVDPGLVVGLIAGGDYALRHSIEGAEDDAEQGAEDLKAPVSKPGIRWWASPPADALLMCWAALAMPTTWGR